MGDQSPSSPNAITQMAKFVKENPRVFEQLGRFIKKKGKEKVESSKCQPDHSAPESSEGSYQTL